MYIVCIQSLGSSLMCHLLYSRLGIVLNSFKVTDKVIPDTALTTEVRETFQIFNILIIYDLYASTMNRMNSPYVVIKLLTRKVQ